MWEEISFPDTLVENSVGRKNQINGSEILPFGKYPVIDQGQDFIAGYCDDETKLVKDELPLVIFGDHTRCFKFVDFPFILGADGTKVLKPNSELFDSKFYYFALLSLDIQNRGYNRHFTLLKEKKVPKPEFDEQRRIAHVLATVQATIEQQARLIALTRELKSALMRKLFTEGVPRPNRSQRPVRSVETEIGLVPESWEVVKIGSIGKCVTGTTPKTAVKEYYSPAEYDFIGPADLGHTRDIYNSEKKISRNGLGVIRSLPKNAVMCVCIGSSIGKLGMTWREQSATNQQINSVICNDKYNPKFVYYLLDYYSNYWRGFATFGPVPILNKNRFEGIDIPVPSKLEEQDEIVELLASLDSKFEFHDKKKTLLEELFRTLLHQLMTGQVRVNDLELI